MILINPLALMRRFFIDLLFRNFKYSWYLKKLPTVFIIKQKMMKNFLIRKLNLNFKLENDIELMQITKTLFNILNEFHYESVKIVKF
jgi:hypothetical protein